MAAMSARATPADRTVSRVSERRYGRISGIGYCVTSVTRRGTARGPRSFRSTRDLATLASVSESGRRTDDVLVSNRARQRSHEPFAFLKAEARSGGIVSAALGVLDVLGAERSEEIG